MHVNFYKKKQIKTHKTTIKVEKSVLFLDFFPDFFADFGSNGISSTIKK
jgi:hypothetical protein